MSCQQDFGGCWSCLHGLTFLLLSWIRAQNPTRRLVGNGRQPSRRSTSSFVSRSCQGGRPPPHPVRVPARTSGVIALHPSALVYTIRLLVCRTLHLPLPLTLRACRCGRQLDMFGHHRAACAETRALGRRRYPLEVAAAHVCRCWRSCVHERSHERNLSVFNVWDGRRLEVVVDGLTLFRGARVAIDTTCASCAPPCTARRRGADVDGAGLEVAQRRKERACCVQRCKESLMA